MFWFWTALAVFSAPALFFLSLGFWIMAFKRTPHDGRKELDALERMWRA